MKPGLARVQVRFVAVYFVLFRRPCKPLNMPSTFCYWNLLLLCIPSSEVYLPSGARSSQAWGFDMCLLKLQPTTSCLRVDG